MKTNRKFQSTITICLCLALFGIGYSQNVNKSKLDSLFDRLLEKNKAMAGLSWQRMGMLYIAVLLGIVRLRIT